MSILRSLFAAMVGYMAMMVVVIALTLLFVRTMGLKTGHPTAAYLAINVVYSFLAATIGGYIAGRIERIKPLQAGAILAGLMLLLGIVSYHHYTGLQPAWYQVLMVVAPPLCAVGGATLYARGGTAGAR